MKKNNKRQKSASIKCEKKRKYMTKKRIHERNTTRAKWLVLILFLVINLGRIGMAQFALAKEAMPTMAQVTARHAVRQYAYNERVPEEIIVTEIEKQANLYSIDTQKAIKLARCESTDPIDGKINNLIKNDWKKTNTALGVYQFVITTWQETESFKKHRLARTDYKANIKEAMILLSKGGSHHWEHCGRVAGFHK